MNVCVFCGSATGKNPVYAESAGALGRLIGQSGFSLVYGGGNIGLMGIVADAVIAAGGKVTGIIPDFLLKREVGHRGITELEVVDSMHERKQRMATLANAFVALPGGWGTLEELAEILTWRQLGLAHQPVILLNINRYFDPLLKQLRLMADEGFLASTYLEILHVTETPQQVISQLSRKSG